VNILETHVPSHVSHQGNAELIGEILAGAARDFVGVQSKRMSFRHLAPSLRSSLMHDDTRLRLRLASGGETRILVGREGLWRASRERCGTAITVFW
jgi:hypothetical protein